MKKKPFDKLSITAFVLSSISILGIGLFGIIGMILGIVSLYKILQTKESGIWFSVAAIVIGFIWGILLGIGNQIY